MGGAGYPVRPYSDFGLKGKLIKASLPLRESPALTSLYLYPIRGLRLADAKLRRGPTSFHYWLLTPNYEHYWMPDSDALNSMDPYEGYLWFASRGDECLNCPGAWDEFVQPQIPLILRIKKSEK